jgi:hypothetical protein
MGTCSLSLFFLALLVGIEACSDLVYVGFVVQRGEMGECKVRWRR